MGLLEEWKITTEELNEILAANPSLRGITFGYVGEYKLKQMWFSDDRISELVKFDDHDRTRRGDMTFTYKGVRISTEAKSLQTHTVKSSEDRFSGRFQCDASDKRVVALPNGSEIETTCLLAGEFDLLAVNLFAFKKEWLFAFAKNADLPRTNYRKYTPEQRAYLIATTMQISWPVEPPFHSEPFYLLDQIVQEKNQLPHPSTTQTIFIEKARDV